MTTLTCIADYMSWPSYTNAEKLELGKLYVPYLAICELPLFFPSHALHILCVTDDEPAVLMGVDMYVRLSKTVVVARIAEEGKKRT